MCREKRSLFGIIDMSGEDPKTRYSFNPTAIQWWVWFGGKCVAIFLGLWLGIAWVSANVFDEQLREFHRVAQPQIHKLVEEHVASHESGHVTDARIDMIEMHDAAVEQRLQSMEKQLDKMDGKLDILIRNGHDAR